MNSFSLQPISWVNISYDLVLLFLYPLHLSSLFSSWLECAEHILVWLIPVLPPLQICIPYQDTDVVVVVVVVSIWIMLLVFWWRFYRLPLLPDWCRECWQVKLQPTEEYLSFLSKCVFLYLVCFYQWDCFLSCPPPKGDFTDIESIDCQVQLIPILSS